MRKCNYPVLDALTGPLAWSLLFLTLAAFGCSAPSAPSLRPMPTDAGDAGQPPSDGGSTPPEDAGFMVLPPLNPLGVSTLTGGDQAGGVDGPRGVLRLNNPVNVLARGETVFVADFYNDRIVSVGLDGAGVTLAARDGFSRPFGLTMGLRGMLWIQTDRSSMGTPLGAIWQLDLPSRELALVLDGAGRNRGLTTLPDGRLAMADYEAATISILDTGTRQLTLLAGGPGALGYVNGRGAAARFREPRDLVLTPRGTLLVVDTANHSIREVTLDGEVSTFAGAATPGSDDGPRLSARFSRPLSLAQDDDGNVYVGDGDNFIVRKIAPDGEVTTLAGTGESGFADEPHSLQAKFRGLEGMDVSPDGQFLLVADGPRGADEPFHRVRRVALR